MKEEQLYNLPQYKGFRRDLRNGMTPAEISLWQILKGRQVDGLLLGGHHDQQAHAESSAASIGPIARMLYLSVAMLPMTLIGAYLDRDSHLLYPIYADFCFLPMLTSKLPIIQLTTKMQVMPAKIVSGFLSRAVAG